MQRYLRSSVFAVALASSAAAVAAPADIKPPLADDVVPAPDGFEPVTGKYVAAQNSDLYISWFMWGGKVKDMRITAGQPVDVLARLREHDWALVGKNGQGIGYVPMAALRPAAR